MEQMKNSDRVKSKIEEALRAMAAIYSGTEHKKDNKSNSWSDGDNESGLIISCEALECFFVPSLFIEDLRRKFLDGQLLPLEAVRRTVLDLTNQEYLYGSPYIDFRRKGSMISKVGSGHERDLEFIDAAAWMASCLFDLKRLMEERARLVPRDYIPNVNRQFGKALKVLRECHYAKERGWNYTNSPDETDRTDFLYCTLTAIESLEVILRKEHNKLVPDDAKQLVVELGECFSSAKRWIEASFLGGYVGGENLNLQEGTIRFSEIDRSYYYNLYAIIILLLAGSQKIKEIDSGLELLLHTMADPVSKRKILGAEFKFPLEGALADVHGWSYADRCFVPLILKALTLYAKANPERRKDLLPGIREWEETLYEYMNPDIPGLWDNTRLGYSIFYTQRAIESLTHLWSLYVETEEAPPRELAIEQFIDFIAREVRERTPELRAEVITESQRRGSELEAKLAEATAQLSILQGDLDDLTNLVGEIVEKTAPREQMPVWMGRLKELVKRREKEPEG